jgi:hypothetical protein
MSFASLFIFVRKKIVLLSKVNLFTVVVTKHVRPYFHSISPNKLPNVFLPGGRGAADSSRRWAVPCKDEEPKGRSSSCHPSQSKDKHSSSSFKEGKGMQV